METIKLNMIPTGATPVVHVKQYDTGRQFRCDLYEGTAPYTLAGTETLELDVKKTDGNIVTVAVTNTSAAYVEISTTLQMCACSGNQCAALKIIQGAVEIASLNFILACERSPLENGIQSDSGIHNLQTQIAEAVADQYDADSVIFDAAPTADHGIGYAVTSEGLLAYIPKTVGALDDVSITSATPGEAIVWDGAEWVNGTVSTVGNLDDLSDVDTTGKANGDSLRYDGNEWIAQPTTVALTQAEYDALQLSGDLVPNTHYVITDAPNLNPTASDIEYSSGVTVYQAISSENTPNTASYVYKPIITEPTLDSGASHNNRTWYYKHGFRVCVSIGVKSLNTGVSNQDLFVLPVGYRPRNTLSLVCSGYSFDKKSVVILLADGTVRVTATEDEGAFAYIEFDAYS